MKHSRCLTHSVSTEAVWDIVAALGVFFCSLGVDRSVMPITDVIRQQYLSVFEQ